jgi:hypothetical protein
MEMYALKLRLNDRRRMQLQTIAPDQAELRSRAVGGDVGYAAAVLRRGEKGAWFKRGGNEPFTIGVTEEIQYLRL